MTSETRPAIPMRGATPPRPGSPALAALAPLLGAVLALVMVAMFVVLDYRFEQAPHRLVKILLAGAMMAGILIKPRFGLYVIPVVTPFLPWIPPLGIPGLNPLNILLGSVFMTWALHRVLNRQTLFRPSWLGWTFGVMIAIGALSIVRGGAFPTGYYFDAGAASLELFRGTVTIAVYFMVLAMARGERDRRWLTWAVVLGLLLEALVTIAYGRNGRGARAEGSIGQSNELGAFLALYTVLAAALIPAVRSWLGRGVLALATIAGSYAVIMTVSRGSVLALAVGLAFVALRTSRVMAGLLLVLVLTSPWWTPQYLKDRMVGTQVEVEGTDEAALEGSAQLRIDTWRAITQLVTEHPLDGVGFAGLAYVLPEAGDELGIEVKDSAHNTFLRFLGEMGIFGLGIFLFLLWRCFQLAREGIRTAASRFDRQIAVGLGAATLSLAVSCAFGDRFWNILITGSFWFLCALVNDLVIERRPARP